ncbi:hypothetical protein [Methylocystis sp. S23]
MVTPQLDGPALDILRAAVERSSIAAVARQLDYSRPAVSQALAGKYPGDARHLRAAILETLTGRHNCPALAREVAQSECAAFRAKPLPCGPRSAVARWETCQRCDFNPASMGGVDG